jgi:hypothetical protein
VVLVNAEEPAARGVDNEVRVAPVGLRRDCVHLAEMLCQVPGVEEAFCEHREQPGLPNAKFYFDDGAQDREIDVPLRFGEVLLAVQTWAPEVDLSIDAGDHKAMKRRWEKAKHKLRQTDQRYTDYLLEDVEGKRCMDNVGLRYVLPVVCGPYAEPAVTFEPDFWLRYPSYDAVGQVQAPAVPRVLTPMELEYFLVNTTEQELKEICETNGWKLLP